MWLDTNKFSLSTEVLDIMVPITRENWKNIECNEQHGIDKSTYCNWEDRVKNAWESRNMDYDDY